MKVFARFWNFPNVGAGCWSPLIVMASVLRIVGIQRCSETTSYLFATSVQCLGLWNPAMTSQGQSHFTPFSSACRGLNGGASHEPSRLHFDCWECSSFQNKPIRYSYEGSADFFCKKPVVNMWDFADHSPGCSYSTGKSSPRPHKNKWVWLCSHKTLFVKQVACQEPSCQPL